MPLCSFRTSLSAQPISENGTNDSVEETATSPTKNLRLVFNAILRRDSIGNMTTLFWSCIGLSVASVSTLLVLVSTWSNSRLCYQPIFLFSGKDGS